jgi:hypothetical protein
LPAVIECGAYDQAVVRLDRVTADEAAAEAAELGYLAEPHPLIPQSKEEAAAC